MSGFYPQFYDPFCEGPRYARPVPERDPDPPEFHQVSPKRIRGPSRKFGLLLCAFCPDDAHYECDGGCGQMVCREHGQAIGSLILCPVCRGELREGA